jgi:hypothetical protein
MGVGRRLAVPAEKDLIVANDDENHAGGAGLKEESWAESIDGLRVGWRCLRMPLCANRHEGKHEEEDTQRLLEFRVAHFVCRYLGYKIKPFP